MRGAQQRSVAPDERQAREAGAVATRTTSTCSAPTPRPSAGWRRRSARRRQGKFQQQRRARAGRAGELHPRGQARQPDRAQHARGAVRGVHRAHAPEHPQAVGLRRARGLGRAVGLEPAQQPEPVDHAGDGAEPRRHRRQGHDRARVGLPGVRRGGDRRRLTAPAPIPIRRARSARRTARSTSTGSFYRDERQCATSRRRLLHPRQPAEPAPTAASSRTRRPRRRRAGQRAARPRRQRAPARRRAPPGRRTPQRRAGGDRAAPSTTGGDGGLRRLRRFDDKRHRAKMRAPRRGGRDGRGATRARRAVARRRRPRRRPRRAAPPCAKADPAARAIAERWFKALAGGDIGGADGAGRAAVQDVGQGRHQARDADRDAHRPRGRGEVGARADDRSSSRPPGLRAAIGKLPANVDDGSGDAAVRARLRAARATR